VTRAELALLLDHSVLKPEATETDIRAGADLVRELRIGFFCVQPCWVKLAAETLGGDSARVVSVVGFPHGCDRSEIKVRAAVLAVAEGAREIDMVMNFGALRSGLVALVATEIESIVVASQGMPVKVIIEAAALSESEKRLACRIAVDAGAAFVKTSTGFHPSGGATAADVRLMRAIVGPNIGVKASGGIRSVADVRAMLDAGANRIGTSASASIIEQWQSDLQLR
jgi:deoxyribose-phosphate aldolase